MKRPILCVLCVFVVGVPAWAHAGKGIAVDAQGQVYFADTIRDCIWKVDRQGRLQLVARGKHTDVVFLDEAGNAYFGHDDYQEGSGFRSKLWKAAPDGRVSEALAVPEKARGHLPGRAVDGQGNVYLADSSNRRIQKVAPSGQATTVARSGWPWTPTGVAVAGGDLYVLERRGDYHSLSGPLFQFAAKARLLGNPRVRRISPDGRSITVVVIR